MSTANVESAQGFLEGFNRRDLDSAVRNCAEDFVLTDFPSGQQVKGAEGTKGWLGMWSQAFSDGLIGDMRFHDAGDAVIAEAVFAGTNDGPWGPMQPTGKRASMPFARSGRSTTAGKCRPKPRTTTWPASWPSSAPSRSRQAFGMSLIGS